MKGREIFKSLEEMRTDKHCFVKWWRKENDFLDYDLIDRFMKNANMSDEIGGFELLTLDEMWNEVKRVGGARVKLLHESKGDVVEWHHKGKTGEHTEVCVYTPETVMQIFDVETKGNPVCAGF